MSVNRDVPQQEETDIALSVLHGWLFLLVVDIFALMFGFAFFLIAHSLTMVVIRQAHHWQPAHRFLERIVGPPTKSSSSNIVRILVTVHSAIWMVITVAFIGFGIWILFTMGFWEQNIIWIACN